MASLNYKTEDGWKKVAGGKTGVLTFNGRAGVVTPKEGDYTAEMVGARPNTWMPNIAEVGGVNPNLLDNWYFGNPVNQRGQTEYTGVGYTIDRWYMMTSDYSPEVPKLIVEDDGITIIGEGYTHLRHAHELSDIPIGTYTLSVLVDELEGSCQMASYGAAVPIYLKKGMNTVTFTLTEAITHRRLYFINYLKGQIKIRAAKLELGSTQTLAHQDADGNWVLNEIPDYGTELAKCQRYQVDINGLYPMVQTFGGNGYWFTVQLPRELRATPTINLSAAKILTGGTSITIDGSYALYGMRGRTLIIQYMPTTATTLIDPVLSLPVGTIADANL